jgi:hypothetical protein
MPSCRFFQALFSSEEQKTTRSTGFRALFPPRHQVKLVKHECNARHTRHPPDVRPLQSFLPLQTAEDFASTTLLHFRSTRSYSAEAPQVLVKHMLQGLARKDWLVSLKTADSHGVCGLVVALKG